jgi:D-alanine transaminase
MTICYLNGEYLPLADARVSPMDRGFLFGDGAYEVIPVYSRKPFREVEHLNRLQATLDGIRLPNPHTLGEWQERIARIIAEAPSEDQSIYLQVTRGADAKRDHAFPKGVAQTTFIMSAALVPPPAEVRAKGVAAFTVFDNRWLRCDLKTVALLANVLLRQQAIDQGGAECILLRDGFLTEGAASNIFVVKDGVLLAPPKSHLILPGITYDVVLELAAAHGLAYEIREIHEDELRSADELWMTSSTKEVTPITRLDDKPVGAGVPGPEAARMHAWYQDYKNTVMRAGRG